MECQCFISQVSFDRLYSFYFLYVSSHKNLQEGIFSWEACILFFYFSNYLNWTDYYTVFILTKSKHRGLILSGKTVICRFRFRLWLLLSFGFSSVYLGYVELGYLVLSCLGWGYVYRVGIRGFRTSRKCLFSLALQK